MLIYIYIYYIYTIGIHGYTIMCKNHEWRIYGGFMEDLWRI